MPYERGNKAIHKLYSDESPEVFLFGSLELALDIRFLYTVFRVSDSPFAETFFAFLYYAYMYYCLGGFFAISFPSCSVVYSFVTLVKSPLSLRAGG